MRRRRQLLLREHNQEDHAVGHVRSSLGAVLCLVKPKRRVGPPNFNYAAGSLCSLRAQKLLKKLQVPAYAPEEEAADAEEPAAAAAAADAPALAAAAAALPPAVAAAAEAPVKEASTAACANLIEMEAIESQL